MGLIGFFAAGYLSGRKKGNANSSTRRAVNYRFIFIQIQLYPGAEQLILSFPYARIARQNSDAGGFSILKPGSSGESPFCLIQHHVSDGHNSIDFPTPVLGRRPAFQSRLFGFQRIHFEAIRLYAHISLVCFHIPDEHDEILPTVHFHLIGGNADRDLAI